MFMRENNIKFKNHVLVSGKLQTAYNKNNTNINTKNLNKKVRCFCNYLTSKWLKSKRTHDRFVEENKVWLKKTFVINNNWASKIHQSDEINHSTLRQFNTLGDRQKRRRTTYLHKIPKEHIEFSIKKSLSPDCQYVFDFLKTHPNYAQKVRSFCEGLLTPKNEIIGKEQALSISIAADLTKNQYNVVRKYATNFPSYYQLQKAKSDCYPSKSSMTITESACKLSLQNLLDKTTERIFKSLQNMVERNDTHFEHNSYTLVSKWSCDGASDQSEYNMRFTDNNNLHSDNNLFICSFVGQ